MNRNLIDHVFFMSLKAKNKGGNNDRPCLFEGVL